MATEARELPDRWILPLRWSRVTQVDWDDRIRFRLEPPGEIAVGSGALFTDGPATAPSVDAKTLGQMDHDQVQLAVGASILSAVGFKNGALRVVLDNGWHLNVRSARPFVPASVTFGESGTWSRHDVNGSSSSVS
jgi:hypothetical protein